MSSPFDPVDPVDPLDPVEQHGALFRRDGEGFAPTQLARGPWDPNACHGGAPSALLAYLLGRHDPGPASFVARLTIELLRPVPLAPLQVAARTFRPGQKVQWLEGALLHDGREVARATALRLRVEDVRVDDAVSPPVVAAPARAGVPPARLFEPDHVGMWSAHEMMISSGSWEQAGPSSAWFRLRCPVVDDEPATPTERVAAAADFGSGVGNPLPFVHASAINPEVTIHLHRHPAGDWVCLESGGWAEGNGVGMVETRLHDEQGPIGRAVQTLLVEPMRPGVGRERR